MEITIPVYLDYNATTPCDPVVVEAMLPFFTRYFGNAASRSHRYGWAAEEAVDHARKQVAALVGAQPQEIVFTSGATEADNLAIKGVFELFASKGNHIITTSIEHKAVLDTCAHVEKTGADITYLPVNEKGLISLDELESAIRPATILISVMYANNETGTIQPVKEIGAIAKKHGVLFFSDAVQAVGKIPVNVLEDDIDLMAFTAHKMYGPKGVGALYVRRKNPRARLAAQMDGGGHERGMRSGTLNLPGIVGFGKACELAQRRMTENAQHVSLLRDRLEKAVLNLGEVYVNGDTINRLPHVSNLAFKWVEGDALMMGLNKSLAVSSGSACTSASIEPSHVLKALGRDDEMAHASIRFSLGKFTTEEEIEFAITQVKKAVTNLRELSPLWEMHKPGKPSQNG
jgi:cysteine desulfurase